MSGTATATTATSAIVRTVLRSDEFTCPSCVRTVETALARLGGVERSTVHVATGRVEVHHDPATASVDQLVEAVRAVGYRVTRAPF